MFSQWMNSMPLTTFGLMALASASIAPEVRAQMEVDSCRELPFPGEYVLTEDLIGVTGDCIVITRSRTTFDGQGHHIVGPGQTGTGIEVERNVEDIEIRDLLIGRFEVGIAVGDGAREGTISDVRLAANDDGLNLDGKRFTLSDSTIAINEDVGVRTRGVSNVIEGNTFRDNQVGLYVAWPDYGATIRDNRFIDHTRSAPAEGGGFVGRPGMAILVRSGSNSIRDNTFENNTRGIHIREDTTDDVSVRFNTVRGSEIGVDITAFATDVWVVGNTIEENATGIGIRDGADRIGAWGNTIRNNTARGVLVRDDLPLGRIPDRPDEDIDVGFNSFSGNHLGVDSQEDYLIVDARNAYWGSADGPSGYQEDPVTGTPSAGEGDEVRGEVRFDPWLGSPDSVFLMAFLLEHSVALLGAGLGP